MTVRGVRTGLAYRLASGNTGNVAVKSGLRLPLRSGVERRVDAFLAQATGADAEFLSRLRSDIHHTLQVLYNGIAPEPDPPSEFAKEAIVIADGSRPVFFCQGGTLQPGPGNGPFVDLLNSRASVLAACAQSVGRIESDVALKQPWADKWFAGTGFMVGPNLVMTNRHVAEWLVNEPTSAHGPFTLNGEYFINFDAEFGSTRRTRFRIAGIAFMSPSVIGGVKASLAHLDVALLHLGVPEGSSAVPPPLPLTLRPQSKNQPLAVIGFPDRPRLAAPGTPHIPPGFELGTVLTTLFDMRFGWKRCASGQIHALAGSYQADVKRWAMKHDASTLNGNSGSPVLDMSTQADTPAVLALHFAGVPRMANYAHVASQLKSELGAFNINLEDS